MKKIRIIFLEVLCGSVLLNLIISTILSPILFLTENQVLYIFSDLGQVTAGLFGLTFAVYSIVDSKEKKLGENDTTATDFSEEIRKDYFTSIVIITLLSIATILSSILVLNFYIQYNNRILSFIMNQSGLFFVALIIEIVSFVFYLNPKKMNIKGSEEKQLIEEEYNTDERQDKNFTPFVTYYNLLENLLNKFASIFIFEEVLEVDFNSLQPKRLRILQCLDILMKNEIIDKRTYRKIDELRKYRNALVHSLDNDKAVNGKLYSQLEQIYNKSKIIYEKWDEESKRGQYINDLKEYVEKITFGDNAINIIKLLKERENITMKEISNETNMSIATVDRILDKLEEYEVIERSKNSGKTIWIVKNDNIDF